MKRPYPGVGHAIDLVVGTGDDVARMRGRIMEDGLLQEMSDVLSQAYQNDQHASLIVNEAEIRYNAILARANVAGYLMGEAKKDFGLVPPQGKPPKPKAVETPIFDGSTA